MSTEDPDLIQFAAGGAWLPVADLEGYCATDGARIWYAVHGSGPDVILLHGGMGHGGNWGHQVPDLVAKGFRTITIDSRGHGRSTRDERPYSYDLMANDVLAVMDALDVSKAAMVGWSDGACIALILAMKQPERSAGVLFFACNMDPSGTMPFEATPVIDRCIGRHIKDYEALSATPESFQDFADAVGLMQRTQPNATAADLAKVAVPVTVVQSESDEFITLAHAQYLAASIPDAKLRVLDGVSHFAPIQNPALFNAAVLDFLARVDA